MRSVAENAISDLLGHLPPVAVYAVVATAAPAESVLRVGAFIPTLTLLLTAGALARTGHTSLPLIIAVAAGAVVAGDFRAHRTGRLLADRLRTGRAGRRIPPAVWARAETLMARHGGRAVFLARFLPVVRGLAPPLRGRRPSALPPHRTVQRHRGLRLGDDGGIRGVRGRLLPPARAHPGGPRRGRTRPDRDRSRARGAAEQTAPGGRSGSRCAG
ncbi:DedA family protein [Streptomyces humidus]|uniref:DedA family protein n=1 Tax=Streptomyces humidus TaxID=52259 RepID=UPI00332F0C9B